MRSGTSSEVSLKDCEVTEIPKSGLSSSFYSNGDSSQISVTGKTEKYTS